LAGLRLIIFQLPSPWRWFF